MAGRICVRVVYWCQDSSHWRAQYSQDAQHRNDMAAVIPMFGRISTGIVLALTMAVAFVCARPSARQPRTSRS
ncbi:hypothetical protein ACP4OV_026195 [Aristida adscensionis]